MGRGRRALLIVVAAAAVVVVAGTLVVRHLRADHVDRHGSVYVAISGHEILMPWEDPEITAGTGGGGVLGLINGRCVGFVHDPRIDEVLRADGSPVRTQPHEGEVIVWPAGTKVTGSGKHVRINWQGKEVRLGDRVDGGVDGGFSSAGTAFHRMLPPQCRGADLVAFSLG